MYCQLLTVKWAAYIISALFVTGAEEIAPVTRRSWNFGYIEAHELETLETEGLPRRSYLYSLIALISRERH